MEASYCGEVDCGCGVAGGVGLTGDPGAVEAPGAALAPVVWFGAVAPVDAPGVVSVVLAAGAAGVSVVVEALALVPVEAKLEPDHQSRDARTLGEALRYESSCA